MNFTWLSLTLTAFITFVYVGGQPSDSTPVPLGADCNLPSTFSLTVASTSAGAAVSFKLSGSPNATTILFQGHNVSSPLVCGENYEKCSAFSVVTPEGVTLILLPLGQAVGLLTFNGENASAFQDHHVINNGHNCEFSVFYIRHAPNPEVEFFGLCRDPSTTTIPLLDIQFIVDPVNLSGTSGSASVNPFCYALDPSRIIYFSSPSTDGVVVFVDLVSENTNQWGVYFGDRENCDTFSSFSCSEVQRFVGVSMMSEGRLDEDAKQAVYCPGVTYLINVAQDEDHFITQEFAHAEDGYPIYCSVSIICIFLNSQLSLQFANGSAVLPPVDFVYDDVLTQGDCSIVREQYVVVLYLGNSSVLAVNLNLGVTTLLGVSETPPLVFGENVLLSNSTHHAIVRNLLATEFEDALEQGNLVLGLVLSGPRTCLISTSTPTPTPAPTSISTVSTTSTLLARPTLSTTLTSSPSPVSSPIPSPNPTQGETIVAAIAGSVAVAAVLVMLVILIILVVVLCYKKRTKTVSVQIELDTIDSKHSTSANGASSNDSTAAILSTLHPDSPPGPSPAVSSPTSSSGPPSSPSLTVTSTTPATTKPATATSTTNSTTTTTTTTTSASAVTNTSLPDPSPTANPPACESNAHPEQELGPGLPVYISQSQRPNEGEGEGSGLDPESPPHNPISSLDLSPLTGTTTSPSVSTPGATNQFSPHESGGNGTPVNCSGSGNAAQMVIGDGHSASTLLPPPTQHYSPPPPFNGVRAGDPDMDEEEFFHEPGQK